MRTGTPFRSDSQAGSVDSRGVESICHSPRSNFPAFEDVPIDSRIFALEDTSGHEPLGAERGWWNNEEFINEDFEIAGLDSTDLGKEDELVSPEPRLPVSDATSLGARRLVHGPSISDASFSQMMASVFTNKSESDNLKLPWEKGFCKDFFLLLIKSYN